MSNEINIPLGEENKETIAIKIGSNTFEAPIGIKHLRPIVTKFTEFGEQLATVESDEQLEKILKKAFNTLLGKGAFKKVFAESGDLYECAEVLFKVAERLTATFEAKAQSNMTQAQKAQQFVNRKKNKNRRR